MAFVHKISFIGMFFLGTSGLAQIEQPSPEPMSGYGSKSLETCVPEKNQPCETRFSKFGYSSGKRVTWFVPKYLKNSYNAPVVVFLHGYFSLVPEIYMDHITHLTRQGYIVIFPQFQGGLWNIITESGIFGEAVQQDWLNNAIWATNYALKEIGKEADTSEIYGYGHSLGGAMLLGWEASGGVPMKGVVLANAQTNPKKGMPEFVKRMVKVKPLNWKSQARSISGLVTILTGSHDTVAKPESARTIAESLVFARRVSVFELQSDDYGEEPLMADHMAAATNGSIPGISKKIAHILGGFIELNAYDRRFYYAALDAMLDENVEPEFDTGVWSDGVPVKSVVRYPF